MTDTQQLFTQINDLTDLLQAEKEYCIELQQQNDILENRIKELIIHHQSIEEREMRLNEMHQDLVKERERLNMIGRFNDIRIRDQREMISLIFTGKPYRTGIQEKIRVHTKEHPEIRSADNSITQYKQHTEDTIRETIQDYPIPDWEDDKYRNAYQDEYHYENKIETHTPDTIPIQK